MGNTLSAEQIKDKQDLKVLEEYYKNECTAEIYGEFLKFLKEMIYDTFGIKITDFSDYSTPSLQIRGIEKQFGKYSLRFEDEGHNSFKLYYRSDYFSSWLHYSKDGSLSKELLEDVKKYYTQERKDSLKRRFEICLNLAEPKNMNKFSLEYFIRSKAFRATEHYQNEHLKSELIHLLRSKLGSDKYVELLPYFEDDKIDQLTKHIEAMEDKFKLLTEMMQMNFDRLTNQLKK